MGPTFTVDDIGEPVESAAGDTLGGVVEITTGVIRLEEEFSEERLTSAETDEPESVNESSANAPNDADRQNVGHDPGEPVTSNPTETGDEAAGAGPGADESELMMATTTGRVALASIRTTRWNPRKRSHPKRIPAN